ncbi:MAG TPA: tetratricopeptide repeat protein, partial [Rectinemataceae bacterium]|nr:tetratricopeptide repeat protein [Rectinemataceae bacterium]
GLPPDFASLLDNLPLDESGPEATGAAGAEAVPASEEEPVFDLESFALPEEPESPPPASTGQEARFGEETPFGGEMAFGEEAEVGEEAPVDLEAGEPSEPFPGLAEETGLEAPFEPAAESETVPEPPAEEVGSAPEGVEDFGIPDLGDFDFGGEAAAGPQTAASGDEFSIPEMEAFAGGAGESGDAAPAPEEAQFEAGQAARESPPEEEAPAEEFALPGFEEPAAAEPSFSLGEAALPPEAGPGDSFDSFTFEEGGAAEPSLGSDLDEEIAALSTEVGPGETFSLDQEWGGFGGETTPPRQAPPRVQAPRPSRPAPSESVRPVALSEAQVDRLQDVLLSYPLNLRVAIEDILASAKGTDAQQSKLVWAMVEAASAEEAAQLAGRILKRRIEIPKGFEKKTGAAVEAEKGSFRYAFVHTVLPALRIALAAFAAVAVLGWLGWRFIYTPLAADSLYRSGYRRIAEDRFTEAEQDFDRATAMREFIAWYYRYAQAYTAKRQYLLAEGKYALLIERHPHERAGILAWARLEREQLKYEEAVQVLLGVSQPLAHVAPTEEQRGKTGLLSWDYYNRDGLLLLGDIYLDWGDEDSARFEDARRTYATLIQHYGYLDPYLERMLLYFVRSDGSPGPDGQPRNNHADILALKTHFLGEKRNPLSPAVMAELGGYLMDKNLLDDVRVILLTAAKKDPALPEAHYQLVRYFRRAGDQDQERVALDNAIKTFSALPGLSPRRTVMYLESLIWRGDYRSAAREWIGAEQDYTTAATVYEQALALRRVKREPRFGAAYAGLATVAFWQRNDLDSALSLLERAAESGYDSSDTRYERGYILYRKGRLADSLEQFYLAAKGGPESPYLGFAFGTALYERGDYLSAEGYLRRVVEAMKRQLAAIDLLQLPQSPSQSEILELLMKADNNLGAALLRSAALVGDARRRAAAATQLASSAQLHDQLAASGVPLGPEPRDLASYNLALAIKGDREPAPLVYTDIERAMAFPRSGLDALVMSQDLKLEQE